MSKINVSEFEKDNLDNAYTDDEYDAFKRVSRYCHELDVAELLSDRGYEFIENDVFRRIVDKYEDELMDSEEWHSILDYIISSYEEELTQKA